LLVLSTDDHFYLFTFFPHVALTLRSGRLHCSGNYRMKSQRHKLLLAPQLLFHCPEGEMDERLTCWDGPNRQSGGFSVNPEKRPIRGWVLRD
jgi:hypothetical protein